jgi:5-formyltetrahydrofolate cyclo-ligase
MSNVSRQTLRQAERLRRAGISDSERLQMSSQITNHCVTWLQGQRLKPQSRIALYWPIHGEPSILPLMRMPQCANWLWALPKVEVKNRPLQFIEYTVQDSMSVDHMGIATPTLERHCRVDIIFIPCLGFTAQRHRLGYGGGFYDRTLAAAEFAHVKTVGIAYSASQTSNFLPDAHDIALQEIITELGVLRGKT